MKVALLISGSPRTFVFDEVIDYFIKFINSYKDIEFDIYIIFKLNECLRDCSGAHTARNFLKSDKGLENFEKILNIFNPKYINCFYNFIFDDRGYYSQIKMIDILIDESIKNEILHNFKYDFFIRMRPDSVLREKIDFNSLNKDYIYTCYKHDAPGSDQFFIINQKILYEWWIKDVRPTLIKGCPKYCPEYYIFNKKRSIVKQFISSALVRDYNKIVSWTDKYGEITIKNFWYDYSEYLKFLNLNNTSDFENNIIKILKALNGTFINKI